MILQNILKYRNDSNLAQTLLSTIKSSGANPPEKKFFLIMLFYILLVVSVVVAEGNRIAHIREINFAKSLSKISFDDMN